MVDEYGMLGIPYSSKLFERSASLVYTLVTLKWRNSFFRYQTTPSSSRLWQRTLDFQRAFPLVMERVFLYQRLKDRGGC